MLPTESSSEMRATLEKFKPGMAFVVMIFGALIAFEIFNYSTTDHALGDLLGDLTFAGIPWSTVLAIAFCGIDFAGIARLFTPEQGMDEPKEVWYLFGAWLLAATMNAILTWWGVSLAVANHNIASSSVVDPGMITSIVPVFVAIMVWVIRILIIGTLSLSMDRLLHPGGAHNSPLQSLVASPQHAHVPAARASAVPAGLNSSGYTSRPAVRSVSAAPRNGARQPAISEGDDDLFGSTSQTRTEPTYHSISGGSRPATGTGSGNTAGNRYRR